MLSLSSPGTGGIDASERRHQLAMARMRGEQPSQIREEPGAEWPAGFVEWILEGGLAGVVLLLVFSHWLVKKSEP